MCCDAPSCAKCLLVACKNDDCPTHTLDLKIRQYAYRLSGYRQGERNEGKQKLEKEFDRLRNVKK